MRLHAMVFSLEHKLTKAESINRHFAVCCLLPDGYVDIYVDGYVVTLADAR